jgi:hypothetical protein
MAYLPLLSLLYFQPLPPELKKSIKAIEDEQPEMNDALVDGSGKGLFLVALAGLERIIGLGTKRQLE